MLLDILDDIFLLHLAFEAAKRAFDRFAFLHFDFSQALLHPLRRPFSNIWHSHRITARVTLPLQGL
jgi:hypothetical protein